MKQLLVLYHSVDIGGLRLLQKYMYLIRFLTILYLQTAVNMVTIECSTVISLPFNIKGGQCLVKGTDKGAIALGNLFAECCFQI